MNRAFFALLIAFPVSAQSVAQADWSAYGRDAFGSRYSPLAQITRDNVTKLTVAWTYRTGEADVVTRQPAKFEATPLMVDGTLFLSTPFGVAIALDPATGAERWRYDAHSDRGGNWGDFANRGVSTWLDASAAAGSACRRRIFLNTVDARIIALDSKTGVPCKDFGKDGVIRLKDGLHNSPYYAEEYALTSPPAVIRGMIVTGSAVADNNRTNAASGEVRAYDARTGAQRWSWDPIPRDSTDLAWISWRGPMAHTTGAANAWSVIAADSARDLVFIPTGSASPDYYGGERVGDNHYANSVVALRASTGKMVWHFQAVHHDLWDYDVASPPALVTITHDGKRVDVVLQATKSGQLFVLDRDTGKPVFPVEERPVPASNVQGEVASKTQPFNTVIPPLSPQTFSERDVYSANPTVRDACLAQIRGLRNDGVFTPPSFQGSLVLPSNIGGAHWGGLAFDPHAQIAVVPVNRIAAYVQLVRLDELDTLQMRSNMSRLGDQYTRMHGTPYVMRRRMLTAGGAPCVAPPWGSLVAINLNTGALAWDVPLGDVPGTAPDVAAARPPMGIPNLGGPIITAGGIVFIGATMDHVIRAFDVATGKELWKGPLPGGARATPMTYSVNGRQYVVIAVGGNEDWGKGDYVVAFALPDGSAKGNTRGDAAPHAIGGVQVTVSRSDATTQTAPWAVGIQTQADIAGAHSTLGIDEALPNIPGVYVANRYNYALDQRLSIRGAGARANFGLRGVKVLLDGVPQSLPDGQSQLTNIDLADISRVEVLRGSASSLYGNGSGGVIAFSSDRSAPDPLGQTIRLTGGSFGMSKIQERTSGRIGSLVGALSWSRTTLDGFRQYSRADSRQFVGSLDYGLSAATSLALSVSAADIPKAQNPGALTAAEYVANRDSAAAVNVQRGASREVSQQQYSLRVHHTFDEGDWSAVAFAQRRFVDNALATPPPGPAGAENGTYSTINRLVTGARLDGSRRLCNCAGDLTLSGGLDYERSADIRRNRRSTGGRPRTVLDTLLVFQDEIVTALGAFAQLQWKPVAPMTINGGVRYDHIGFTVHDHFLGDGADNSASRPMTSPSWHAGATYVVNEAFTPYAIFSTAFETPTTTELSARSDGLGGFNPDLGPQHEQTIEGGARGALNDRLNYSVSIFHSTADGAIIQYLETNGRAFFRNAGRTRNDGVELGLNATVAKWLDVNAAWTLSSYTFTDYRVPNGAVTDTLDGRTQAGVPDHFTRLGLRAHWRGAELDVDHTLSSAMWADDKNSQRIGDWGSGVLNIRASYSGEIRQFRIQPFVAVNNVTNESYVGAVTLNGAFGRTIEPAPLRNFYFGTEIGWRAVK